MIAFAPRQTHSRRPDCATIASHNVPGTGPPLLHIKQPTVIGSPDAEKWLSENRNKGFSTLLMEGDRKLGIEIEDPLRSHLVINCACTRFLEGPVSTQGWVHRFDIGEHCPIFLTEVPIVHALTTVRGLVGEKIPPLMPYTSRLEQR